MEHELDGLQVVVTGATGELGRAVAQHLAERGAFCHLPCRTLGRAAPFAPELAERARFVEGIELTDEDSLRDFYQGLPSLWASVHCAGAFHAAPLTETTLADLERMLSANLRTSFLASREALRRLRAEPLRDTRAGRGRILNVAARPALEPRRAAGMVAYGASKAAVAALSTALAEEVAGEGILVNAIAPSVIDTPANRAAMPSADFSRWPTPADLAQAILALVSPRNLTVHGALLPVFGRAL